MPKLLTSLVIFLLFCCPAFATWSIIMIDPKTKEIGIAGASCSYRCYGIGEIIPNVGAVIVQAMSNSDARNKGVKMILAEASPEEVIQAMRDPGFDPEEQQYAVITIKYINDARIYTGASTHTYNGGITDYGVSVQGNTLTGKEVLEAVMAAVKTGKEKSLSISDILLTALEAGSVAGGDKRCGEQRATSAFIIVARPTDRSPYLDLQVFGQQKGKQNAVDLLRSKYNKWKRNQ